MGPKVQLTVAVCLSLLVWTDARVFMRGGEQTGEGQGRVGREEWVCPALPLLTSCGNAIWSSVFPVLDTALATTPYALNTILDDQLSGESNLICR
jgi:hypothetical protein